MSAGSEQSERKKQNDGAEREREKEERRHDGEKESESGWREREAVVFLPLVSSIASELGGEIRDGDDDRRCHGSLFELMMMRLSS